MRGGWELGGTNTHPRSDITTEFINEANAISISQRSRSFDEGETWTHQITAKRIPKDTP